MISLLQIISDVQNEIGDLAMERIQRKEWIDIANDIAMDIAENTHTYIGRYVYKHNNLILDWQDGMVYDQGTIVRINNLDYYCNVLHQADQNNRPPSGLWRLIVPWTNNTFYSAGTIVNWQDNYYQANIDHTSQQNINDPNYVEFWNSLQVNLHNTNVVVIPYNIGITDINAFKILRVIRSYNGQWTECREYSQQAVGRTNSGFTSFEINRTWIGVDGYAVQHTNRPTSHTNNLYIVFGSEIMTNETVIIDYVSNRPWGDPFYLSQNALYILEPTTSQTIPDYLRNAFKWGIQFRAVSRLATKGDETFIQQVQITKQLYDDYLNKAAAYTRNLNSKPYNIRIQPVNWLEE